MRPAGEGAAGGERHGVTRQRRVSRRENGGVRGELSQRQKGAVPSKTGGARADLGRGAMRGRSMWRRCRRTAPPVGMTQEQRVEGGER